MGLRFEHRDAGTDGLVDRVWRTRSDAPGTMMSAARSCQHLIFSWTRGRLSAGLRGPETWATVAPVPPDTEFLGVRLALGAVLRPHPAGACVDGFVPFPVDSGRVLIGGEDWEAPTYENVEDFVRRLGEAGLLVRTPLEAETRSSARTRERRHRAITGLSRTAVTQIDRANAAAMMLREGDDWRRVVDALGYFDQAHLAHALRRYVGRTAGELRAGDQGAMSFLYKTGPEPGS